MGPIAKWTIPQLYMYLCANSPFGDGAYGFGPWRCWPPPARSLPRCDLSGSYTLNLSHGHGGHGEGSFGALILGRILRASTGVFVMLFKNKGSSDDCSKYRMICLLPHAYKMLSTLLLHRLRFECEGFLNECQAGFRQHVMFLCFNGFPFAVLKYWGAMLSKITFLGPSLKKYM